MVSSSLLPLRADAFLAKVLQISRSDSKKLLKQKRIQLQQGDVPRQVLKSAGQLIQSGDQVFCDGELLPEPCYQYWLLHKPAGFVSSRSDGEGRSVLQLLDDSLMDLQIVGRLDADTSGMLLLSDDGDFNHYICSPRQQCSKQYQITLKHPVDKNEQQQWIEKLAQGILLRGEEKPSLPVEAQFHDATHLQMRVGEGRYHLIKRLVSALGNRLETLHRDAIGDLPLGDLAEGDYRELEDADLVRLAYGGKEL